MADFILEFHGGFVCPGVGPPGRGIEAGIETTEQKCHDGVEIPSADSAPHEFLGVQFRCVGIPMFLEIGNHFTYRSQQSRLVLGTRIGLHVLDSVLGRKSGREGDPSVFGGSPRSGRTGDGSHGFPSLGGAGGADTRFGGDGPHGLSAVDFVFLAGHAGSHALAAFGDAGSSLAGEGGVGGGVGGGFEAGG